MNAARQQNTRYFSKTGGAQRQMKLLKQTFELEKEKLREEALVAKENTTGAEFENYANSKPYDKTRNISRVNWDIMPKHFEKKASINTAIKPFCEAFFIDSHSDTLSDISRISSTPDPDKYNQNIKSNKNKHDNSVNNPQCSHIHAKESDINNKITIQSII